MRKKLLIAACAVIVAIASVTPRQAPAQAQNTDLPDLIPIKLEVSRIDTSNNLSISWSIQNIGSVPSGEFVFTIEWTDPFADKFSYPVKRISRIELKAPANSISSSSQSYFFPTLYNTDTNITFTFSVDTENQVQESNEENNIVKKVVTFAGNKAPIITSVDGPTSLKINEIGTWNVKAIDPENGQVTYYVDWGEREPTSPPSNPYSTTFSHSYSKSGTYSARFTVTDDKDRTAESLLNINITSADVPLLTVSNSPSTPPSKNIIAGSQYEMARFTFVSWDTNQTDIEIRKITFSQIGTVDYKKVTSIDLDDNLFNPLARGLTLSPEGKVVFTPKNPLIIKKGTTIEIKLSAFIAKDAAINSTVWFGISLPPSDIDAVTTGGGSVQIADTLAFGNVMTIVSSEENLPDLMAKDITFAKDPTSPSALKGYLEYSICNIGKGDFKLDNWPISGKSLDARVVSKPGTVKMYFHENITLTPNQCKAYRIPDLSEIGITTEGGYSITVEVDSGHINRETNESNNIAAANITIKSEDKGENCEVKIPEKTLVVNLDTYQANPPGFKPYEDTGYQTFWVQKYGVANTSRSNYTFFVDPGAQVLTGQNGNALYVKNGGRATLPQGATNNTVYYEEGALIDGPSSGYTATKCNAIFFVSTTSPFILNTVQSGNKMPTLTITGPSNLQTNEKGTWTLKAEDPENMPGTYIVHWNDPTVISQTDAIQTAQKTIIVTHTYSKEGLYQVTAWFVDDKGKYDMRIAQVQVLQESGKPDIIPVTLEVANKTRGNSENWRVGDVLEIFVRIKNGGTVRPPTDFAYWVSPLGTETIERGVNTILDAGQLYEERFTRTLNKDMQGTVRISLQTDVHNEITEAHEDNNTLTQIIDIGTGSTNKPPVITGVSGPTTLKVNETGTWSVMANDPESGYLSYTVDWGDTASTQPTSTKSQTQDQKATFTHSYSKAGTYTAAFTVTDDKGASAKATLSVKVSKTTESLPDLYISPDFTIGPTLTPSPWEPSGTNYIPENELITVSYKIINGGNATADLSGIGTVTGGTIKPTGGFQSIGSDCLSSTSSVSTIAPQGYCTATATFILTQSGSYSVVFEAAPSNALVESDKTNNTLTIPVTVKQQATTNQPSITRISPTSGPVGTVLTIYGRNLQDDCKGRDARVCQLTVSIGGYEIKRERFVELKVTWAQDRIFLVVPPKAQTGAVRVVRVDTGNPEKSYDITGPSFTVTPSSSPITVTIPSTFTLALNQTAQVNNYQDAQITLQNILTGFVCQSTDCPPVGTKEAEISILSTGGCGANADPRCLGAPGFSETLIIAEKDYQDVLSLRIAALKISDKAATFHVSFLPTVQPTPLPPSHFTEKAQLLQGDKIDELLAEIRELRNTIREQETKIKYLERLTRGAQAISEKTQERLNAFIAYGVDDNTKRLGQGERAAVLHSYKYAFNKLPESEAEIADAILIANGRFPVQENEQAEERAKVEFKRIYLREPDENNPKDNAFIVVAAYGLRQRAENRNLASEARGIAIFKSIYGHVPQTTEEWNVMQGITYSGASRTKR